MMEFIRTRLQHSIFIKIFLGILMLSFGIWGVGDFMNVGPLAPGIALKTGTVEVPAEEVRRRFNREMDRFKESVGVDAATDDAMKRAVMSTVVQDMTRAASINAAAADLGVILSRDQVRDEIMRTPAFQANGKFNQMQFEQLLTQNNLTESQFVYLLETDLRQATLFETMAINAAAPKFLTESLFKYRAETRVADTLLIPASAMTLQAPPTDAELKAVYDQNIAAFTAPEYRKLTALVLASTDLVKPETIDDAELKTFYDENTDRYKTPEKRRVAQIVFDSKEKADAARAHAAPGDNLEAVAAKAKAGSVIDLGDLGLESPLVKTIGPAFNLPVGEISQPVETPLGWHLFEVKKVTPPSVTPFEQAKDSIRKTVAENKGVDAVYDASVQLENAVTSGAPLPEIAKSLGARLIQIEAVDREGNDPRGLEVPNLVNREGFLQIAFATPEGKESRLVDLPARNGYYVVRVESITPPTPKPLIDVRAGVAALWEKQARIVQAQAVGERLVSNIGPSTQVSALETKDNRLSYAPLGPVTRFGEGLQRDTIVDSKRVSPEMLEKLFSVKVGEAFAAPVADGVLVARLRDIVPAQPSGELAAQQAQLAKNLRDAIGGDLINQATRAFVTRYPADVNQQIIDQMITTR